MFQPGILLVTAPNEKVANDLAETLVTERLAACVSTHPITHGHDAYLNWIRESTT